jgi:AcrR family transcriptional regulator
MRPSNREAILRAASKVVETEGIAALTYEAVAAASGLTKGGLLYHFPSKDALTLALHEYQAGLWEQELITVLGMDPGQATTEEKLAAYVRESVRGDSGPELLLMLEARSDPALSEPWRQVMARWLPDPSDIDPEDPRAQGMVVAALAADGLWLSASLDSSPLPVALRTALAEHLARSVTSAPECAASVTTAAATSTPGTSACEDSGAPSHE